jgi:predicted nucleic acid-binding protein
VEGYLLDTNVISVLMDTREPRYPHVKARFDGLGASPVYLPVIAIAEIEYGMAKVDNPDEKQRNGVRRFFADYPIHLAVDDNTVEPYSLIRAQLWRDYATRVGTKHKEKLPEELIHRESGKLLGIDERDLLIASVAAQYNLVLATRDQKPGMTAIDAAAAKLQQAGRPVRLRVDYWNA